MNTLQRDTDSDQHPEESESSQENGLSPAHYALGADCSVLNVEVSPTNSCHNGVYPMCRICYEGDTVEELISPCRCIGSLALVHKGCLERWLNMSHCDKCELCGFVFNMKHTSRPYWQFMCGNIEAQRFIIGIFFWLIQASTYALSSYQILSLVLFSKYATGIESDYLRAILGQSVELEDRNANAERYDEVQQHENIIGWAIICLVIMFILLFCIHLASLIDSIIDHVKLWQRWHLANQDLVLAETSKGQVASP